MLAVIHGDVEAAGVEESSAGSPEEPLLPSVHLIGLLNLSNGN